MQNEFSSLIKLSRILIKYLINFTVVICSKNVLYKYIK